MTDNNLKDTADYIIYILSTAFSPSSFKWFFVIAYTCISFLFDVNQQSALLALFLLILIDFCSGVSASMYLKEAIRSSKIKHTAIKITAYFSVIAGAHLAEKGLLNHLSFLDETVLAFFLLTELISLLENVGKHGIDTPKGLVQKLLDYKNKI